MTQIGQPKRILRVEPVKVPKKESQPQPEKKKELVPAKK